MAKEAKAKKTKNVPSKVKKPEVRLSDDYSETLAQIKASIQEAQIKAAQSANKELVKLYWTIGQTIVEKQEKSGWGTKVIEKLATDLQNAFPDVKGFSRTNVFGMRAFYLAYSNSPTAAGQLQKSLPEQLSVLPWGHNVVLLEKLKNTNERFWYAQKSIENGWSRSSLEMWIENNLYKRQGKAITNFKTTLPAPQSDLAQQTMKDPYLFDFITLSEAAKEKEIESEVVGQNWTRNRPKLS